jgi:sigma-E factor negative regulatory protein RseB
LAVRQQDGTVEVEGGRTAASDDSRVFLDGQAWTSLGGYPARSAPELTRGKYEIAVSEGPTIANHATTRYEARRAGAVIERIYVGEDTGLVLRRELYDARGDVVRSVSFMRVETATPDGSRPPTSVALVESAPRAIDDLDRPYRDPASAGAGFRLLGRWELDDDLVQLYYTDGVLSVSVFEQPGRLEWERLPAGGVDAEVSGRPARRYALPVGEAWVFERGGVVYTCVGDAPAHEIAELAGDVSQPQESRGERLARTIVEPFRW